MKIILTLIYLIFTTGGMIFMKLGGDSLALSLKNGIDFKMGGLTFLGFVLYLGSFLLWQRLLVTFDLSYIVPITTGIMQIVILIIGALIFKESFTIVNILGVLLIIIGVILTAIK